MSSQGCVLRRWSICVLVALGAGTALQGCASVGSDQSRAIFEDHPTRADVVQSSEGEDAINQKLKVLPLNRFYGGREPSDNSFLKEAYEPAKP